MLVLAAALAAPASGLASPGRISVGLEPEADAGTVTAQVTSATGGAQIPGLAPLRALVVSVPDVEAALPAAKGVQGVAFAEPVLANRTISFAPNDPLAAPKHQWYLEAIRAFDFWVGSASPPPLPPVLVAVIDSGIDATNPEFAGRIEAMRSFVSTGADVDSFGHGTMVAGEIAAALDNGRGIAGVAFPGKLLIAKVVRKSGSIPLDAEARAIRWAVDRGASVINLSLGGPRNPTNPRLDTYSELERSAIDYATRHGVVIVAAAGNCAAICPESYANYPAALPHVIGVGATNRGTTTPRFSNRDAVHLDLAAPGTAIVSTLPLAFTDASCSEPGTTVCALYAEDRNPQGTSFSAPLVSAAAALALSESRPFKLRPGQLTTILARAARDIGEPGHDSRSGYGLLNVDETIRRVGLAPSPRSAGAERRHTLARGDRHGDAPRPSSDAGPLRGRPGRLPHRASSRPAGDLHPAKPEPFQRRPRALAPAHRETRRRSRHGAPRFLDQDPRSGRHRLPRPADGVVLPRGQTHTGPRRELRPDRR